MESVKRQQETSDKRQERKGAWVLISSFSYPLSLISCLLILVSCLLLLVSIPAQAAQLSVQVNGNTFSKDQQILANIYLDSQGQSINAVEGKVIFPAKLLQATQIRDGNSAVNFWVTQPKVSQSGISFSGIIPGGYNGSKGFLFSVVLKAMAAGNGSLQIDNASVLQNDGKGTPASISVSSFPFSISNTSPKEAPAPSPVVEIKDTDAPEHFSPQIGSSQDLFSGQWFVAFATQDKGSGVNYYQIREGKEGEYTTVQSPYLLKNQKLDQEIFVKAVDKSGNERVERLSPKNNIAWYQNYIVWGIIILICIIFSFYLLWLKRKPRF